MRLQLRKIAANPCRIFRVIARVGFKCRQSRPGTPPPLMPWLVALASFSAAVGPIGNQLPCLCNIGSLQNAVCGWCLFEVAPHGHCHVVPELGGRVGTIASAAPGFGSTRQARSRSGDRSAGWACISATLAFASGHGNAIYDGRLRIGLKRPCAFAQQVEETAALCSSTGYEIDLAALAAALICGIAPPTSVGSTESRSCFWVPIMTEQGADEEFIVAAGGLVQMLQGAHDVGNAQLRRVDALGTRILPLHARIEE